MANKEKLLRILGERFTNDTESAKTFHEVLSREYKKQLKSVEKALRSEYAELGKALKAEFTASMSRIASEMQDKHMQAIARAEALTDNVRKNTVEETGKVSKGLEQKVDDVLNLHKNLAKRFGEKFERVDTRIEKISEFAVGAPNRSLYVAGQLPSAYYSDVNFIAGTGVTITPGTDETKQQATITISSSGGGIVIETPTGTVNATNTVFTPTQRPLFVIADGITSFENAGYTWDGTNITMSIPPSQYIRDAIP